MKSLEELCSTILNAHKPDVGFGQPGWNESKDKSILSFEAAESAIKELSQHPQKEDAVALLTNKNGHIDIISDALKAIGTPSAFHELFELFKNADEIDQSHIADNIASFKQELLLQKLSKQDLEQIVILGFEYNLNESYAPLLGYLATDNAVQKLLHMIFQTHRSQSYRDHAIKALKEIGPPINETLIEKLAMTWVREEKQTQDIYRKDLLKIFKDTGDKHCLTEIKKLMNDPALKSDVTKTVQSISKRLDIPIQVTYTGATLKEAENKIKQDLPDTIQITDKQTSAEQERFVVIDAFDSDEAESQARLIPLADNEKIIDLSLQTKGNRGILGIGKKRAAFRQQSGKMPKSPLHIHFKNYTG